MIPVHPKPIRELTSRRPSTSGSLAGHACLVALLGIACVSPLLISSQAEAQVIHFKGPLAEAPAVKGLRLYREKRFVLKPHFSFSLQDEYSRTLGIGLTANYHLFDWLGLGFWGMFGAAHITTNLTDEVQAAGQTTERNALSLPSRQRFSDQIGKIQWAFTPQVTWIPLRGKIALFQKFFVDTDFYVFGGGGFVGVEQRADTAAGTCATAPVLDASGNPTDAESEACIQSQTARTSSLQFAPTFGAGLSAYINDWIGVYLEWRGLPFAWNTGGTDERGEDPRNEFPDGVIDGEDSIFRFNHFVNVGVSFAIPRAIRVRE